MNEFLVGLFAAECAFLMAWGLRRPGSVYEFPFLAGAAFAGFLLPQAVALTRDDSLPPGGLSSAMLMSILCAGMCFLGYVWNGKPARVLGWKMIRGRLEVFSIALATIGAVFY